MGRYRDPAGKERSRTFDTKREATAWEAEREREMRRGEWLDPDDENTTVGALAEEWQRGATRPNTVRSREALVNNLGDLHAMPVRAVRPSHIVDWHSTLIKGRPWKKGKPLAESSAAVMAGQLSGLLSRAAEDGIILRVPRFEPPKAPQRTVVNRADLLSPAQVAAMITAAEKKDQSHSPARPWLARMILIAAGSGMRVSELGGLRVRDVDFLRGEIHVRKQSSPDGKSLAEVKSAASVRTIPVPHAVIDAVAEQLAESPRGREESVWIRSNGLFHTRNSIGRALARMIELHGLRPATMHDLRHYYASSLIAAGVPVPGVQVALGHASSATTLNVYTHLWPGSEDVTRRAAEGALRDVTVVRDQCGTSDSNKGARAAD